MDSNASSWKDTLEDWKGFLEILSEKKQFLDCSGTEDCISYFFDQLWDLYEFEDDVEALKIKKLLPDLQHEMNELIQGNYSLRDADNMISRLFSLLNKTKDDSILCGKKPNIWRSPPPETIAFLGATVNLSCEAQSNTRVQYRWRKNGKVIESPNSSIITLHNISLKDEGAYSCEVSNNRGKAMSNVTIMKIHSKPNMTQQPQDINVRMTGTGTALFVCNATGRPHPTFQWYFVQHVGAIKKEVALDVTVSVLFKENVTLSDTGEYYCRASNVHGVVQSRKAHLYVLGYGPATPRISVAFNITTKCQSNSSFQDTTNGSCSEQNLSNVFKRDHPHLMNHITKVIARHLYFSNQNKIKDFHYTSGPGARLSFVIDGQSPSYSSSQEDDIMNEFASSRIKLGKSLKNFYQAMLDEVFLIHWKELTIVGKADTLFAAFPQPECPEGQVPDPNGFLCGE